VKRSAVKHTLSLARQIGKIIRNTRLLKQDPFDELCSFLATTSYAVARVIFDGKITDVDRRTSEGFTLGSVSIDNSQGRCTIEFQNENLVARVESEVIAIVPDIISILDGETAMPITNETLRYGQRVKVIAVRVPPIMRSEAALKQFGPQAFGMSEIYHPLE